MIWDEFVGCLAVVNMIPDALFIYKWRKLLKGVFERGVWNTLDTKSMFEKYRRTVRHNIRDRMRGLKFWKVIFAGNNTHIPVFGADLKHFNERKN